jgi:hypothetical protein
LFHRLFNEKDGNAFFNQLLAPLEEKHEVDTEAKAQSFMNLSQMIMVEKAFLGGWVGS